MAVAIRGGVHRWVVLSNRLVRVIASAFSAGFQLVIRCAQLLPVGSSEHVMGYIHVIVVVLFGECPCFRAVWR